MKDLIFSILILLLISLYFKSLAQIQTTSEIPKTPLIFADQRLATAYSVIQKFKKTIIVDPFNITDTWFGTDVCGYQGFYCDNPPDNKSAITIASVDFNGFQLSSSAIAGFLDKLLDIALFHVNSNYFSGKFPNLAHLPYLYEIDISNNNFSGPFPASIFGMPGLSFLDLRFNFFTRSIPSKKINIKIDLLFLNNNNFKTKLHENAGPDNEILYLTLGNNKFFGSIPNDLINALSGLSEISLLNNMLSGCLPYELGLLKDAVVFDGGNNNLTGPLPFSLGCLEKLEVLNFAGNLLYGEIPESLCGLEKMMNLSLSVNFFTQAGPVCMGLINSGVLDVRKNCIFGQGLQRSVDECAVFYASSQICPNNDTYSKIPCRLPQFSSSDSPPARLAPSST